MMIETLEQLQEDLSLTTRAREYLATPKHWCEDAYYLKRGLLRSVPSSPDKANKSCAMGTLYRFDSHTYGNVYRENARFRTISLRYPSARVIDHMEKILKYNGYTIPPNDRDYYDGYLVAWFNDRYGYKSVMNLFDKTISQLQREIDTQAGLTEPSIPIQVPEPARPRYVPERAPQVEPEPDYEPEVPEREPEKVPA